MPVLAATTAATRVRALPSNDANPAGSAPSAANAPSSRWWVTTPTTSGRHAERHAKRPAEGQLVPFERPQPQHSPPLTPLPTGAGGTKVTAMGFSAHLALSRQGPGGPSRGVPPRQPPRTAEGIHHRPSFRPPTGRPRCGGRVRRHRGPQAAGTAVLHRLTFPQRAMRAPQVKPHRPRAPRVPGPVRVLPLRGQDRRPPNGTRPRIRALPRFTRSRRRPDGHLGRRGTVRRRDRGGRGHRPGLGGRRALRHVHARAPARAVALPELITRIRGAVPLPVIATGGLAGPATWPTSSPPERRPRWPAPPCCAPTRARASAPHKAGLTDPAFDTTVITRAFTGRPARTLRNHFVERYDRVAPVGRPALHHLTGPPRRAATAAGAPG